MSSYNHPNIVKSNVGDGAVGACNKVNVDTKRSCPSQVACYSTVSYWIPAEQCQNQDSKSFHSLNQAICSPIRGEQQEDICNSELSLCFWSCGMESCKGSLPAFQDIKQGLSITLLALLFCFFWIHWDLSPYLPIMMKDERKTFLILTVVTSKSIDTWKSKMHNWCDYIAKECIQTAKNANTGMRINFRMLTQAYVSIFSVQTDRWF